MPRELGDERKRYGRKSFGEQLEDMARWPGQHSVATAAILGFIIVGALLSMGRHSLVKPESLIVGDCLYVRIDSEPVADRPIGDDRDVAAAVLAGLVERAGCGASHGHEVSAVIDIATPGFLPETAEPTCLAAFGAYVGRDVATSRYATFAVIPGPEDVLPNVGYCLVDRRDGQWMDHPARGSAE